MQVRELIDRCCKNDPEAWTELWGIVESAALYPVRRLLQNQRFAIDWAEDVMQDFYLFLQQEDFHHLRTFHGQSMSQFRVYLRTSAIHFTLNTTRKMKRLQRTETKAFRDAPITDRNGPTEEDVGSKLRELESLMEERDKSRFEEILSGAVEGSERTYRRWRRDLYRKYSHRVI